MPALDGATRRPTSWGNAASILLLLGSILLLLGSILLPGIDPSPWDRSFSEPGINQLRALERAHGDCVAVASVQGVAEVRFERVHAHHDDEADPHHHAGARSTAAAATARNATRRGMRSSSSRSLRKHKRNGHDGERYADAVGDDDDDPEPPDDVDDGGGYSMHDFVRYQVGTKRERDMKYIYIYMKEECGPSEVLHCGPFQRKKRWPFGVWWHCGALSIKGVALPWR